MVLLRFFVALLSCLSLSGCIFTYLVKSGYNQFKILSDREPIEKVLKNPNLPADQRHKLELALEVRDFAEKELHLTPTDSYKTFVDLKRPYISWIVTAAEKNELKQHFYWYPIVGSLPYKGFFSKEEAEDEAKEFQKDGFDTMIRGVTAYSTLGWFDDPLLSTMINGEDHNLVNVIIHESTHATLYIKSQADFNERMATFVGNLGTEIFYKKKEGADSKTLIDIKKENEDEIVFSHFITKETEDIKAWYKSHPKPTEDERQTQFKGIQDRFTKNVKPKFKTDNYEHFADHKLNNAVLLYLGTYEYDLSDFAALYKKLDQNLDEFLKACKKLESSADPAQDLKKLLTP